MLISLILAWLAVLLCLLTAFRFIARISRHPGLNHAFHQWHIPVGIALLTAGLLHGILAGNPSGATLVTFSGVRLKDGTYTGSAAGYNGTITLTTVVSGGAVTDIQIVRQSDTDRFFSQAMSLIDTILGRQSLEVDAVSGATYSSAGILNAVYDSLQNAVVSGTLKVTAIDLSAVRPHGGH